MQIASIEDSLHEMSKHVFWENKKVLPFSGQAQHTTNYFSQTLGSDMTCKLFPFETMCMKCRNLFSEENKNNIETMLSTENFTQHAKH